MVKVVQLRFYNNGNINNYPLNYVWENYCINESFKEYKPILQFGIQTLPGTRLYLNQSINPIIIGSTGIFEIDCTNTTTILNSFRIEQESMERINQLENGYLIIDLVYDDNN